MLIYRAQKNVLAERALGILEQPDMVCDADCRILLFAEGSGRWTSMNAIISHAIVMQISMISLYLMKLFQRNRGWEVTMAEETNGSEKVRLTQYTCHGG